jgi:glycosyltransferase involved in cell wall biosynthesis
MLFVNDGSKDKTLQLIVDLQKRDPRVAFLDLSRNYGKEIAMAAGIDYIKGDALVIIDADLQDPPELIFEMLEGIETGYDDVYAKRISRKGETFFKKFTSKMYYQWLKRISDIPVQEDTGDYRMFSRKAIDGLRELKESERNMKGLFSYIGFKKKPILYERDPRIGGQTKWNYFKLTGLAVKGLTSFSITPLRIVSVMGFIVSLCAFIYLIVVLVKSAVWDDPVSGYPSLMSVILFLGGIQLLALGVIGEYIGIIYSETKKRPIYYVNEYRSEKQDIS